MGNRTEYLLATMKTPQYDTSSLAQSSGQVSNALLSLAQQGQARATQESQQKANEYASQLLGQTTPDNYYDNASKLRTIGAYTTPQLQQQIQGLGEDIKNKMEYDYKKAATEATNKKSLFESNEKLLNTATKVNPLVSTLLNIDKPIIVDQWSDAKNKNVPTVLYKPDAALSPELLSSVKYYSDIANDPSVSVEDRQAAFGETQKLLSPYLSTIEKFNDATKKAVDLTGSNAGMQNASSQNNKNISSRERIAGNYVAVQLKGLGLKEDLAYSVARGKMLVDAKVLPSKMTPKQLRDVANYEANKTKITEKNIGGVNISSTSSAPGSLQNEVLGD